MSTIMRMHLPLRRRTGRMMYDISKPASNEVVDSCGCFTMNVLSGWARVCM